MADERIDLRSVNWSQGMFLTPDHFLRQEQYFDSLVFWLLRHSTELSGLIGGGPRVEPVERGASKFDPIVEFDESADQVRVTVSQCRGLTRGGAVVDIDQTRTLSASFLKRELEGVLDIGIYVVARPHAKEPDRGVSDPINPQMEAARRPAYAIRLDLQADEADWGLLVARYRRVEKGLRFEGTPGFIPPCAYMSSYSSLMDAFRQLNQSLASVADRYTVLHRAMVDYIALARSRAVPVDQDLETLDFVGRMVVTLEETTYATLEPLQPPKRYFQEWNRLVRSAALFLSLSPPTREYFALLGEVGDTAEFATMLAQEGEALEMGRHGSVHDDLNREVQKVRRAIDRLSRLEQALEGKYLDYRLSPSLEGLNFVFDRSGGDPILYKSVSKPARPQAEGQDLTFVFAPLRLESRESYRIIVVGDQHAQFLPGDHLRVEVRINRGEGYQQEPDRYTATYDIDGQRNFAVDFRAPADVVTINDVRITMRSAQPIRSAILYVRGRLLTGVVGGTRPYAPQQAPVADAAGAGSSGRTEPASRTPPIQPGSFRGTPRIDSELTPPRGVDPSRPLGKKNRLS